ncbi:MAG: hypothetical protein P0Y60_17570 [Candidatus Microbacterium colombiense]|nr:MAG: hypothetical protein P0Y60_17570 [Microbacterium sp.]
MDIVGLAWIVGIVIAAVVVVIILRAAFRGMRPKAPEAQVYTPSTATPRSPSASSAPSTHSALTPAVTAEIDALVAAGQKIQAIKLYREHAGVGLKEAKDRIDHWSISTSSPHSAAVSHAGAAHTSITPVAASPSSVRAALPPSVARQVDELVRGGAYIVAIKIVREHTGLGLKESKAIIDAWQPRS